MRKILTSLLLMIMLMTISITTVSAGDIPESLMNSDDAQIFFGEVLSYHPNKENPSIEVAIAEVIKGKVEKGTKHTYYNPNTIGDYNIRNGKVYLFTYYDDANSTDIFEVTTYNTKTLKLKHIQGSMWERFEKYINQGKYGEAKIDGIMPYTINIIDCVVGFIIGLGIIVAIIVYKKKKDFSYKNQLISSIIIITLFNILNVVYWQWIYTSIGFIICGLLWIINPVSPRKIAKNKNIKKIIRFAGIVLVLIGIITRMYF